MFPLLFYYQENLIFFVLLGQLSGLTNNVNEGPLLWGKAVLMTVWVWPCVCGCPHACVASQEPCHPLVTQCWSLWRRQAGSECRGAESGWWAKLRWTCGHGGGLLLGRSWRPPWRRDLSTMCEGRELAPQSPRIRRCCRELVMKTHSKHVAVGLQKSRLLRRHHVA